MHDTNDKANRQENESGTAGDLSRQEGTRTSGSEGDYYVNENGFVVLTAKYLLQRGYCCGNGCLHCPYDYEAVPEPKRSLLLQKRGNLNTDK